MKVLILAAGRSKRMKPIEDKNFLNFLGKSLIQRQIEMVREAGFEDIILVGGKHNLERFEGLIEEMGLSSSVKLIEQVDLQAGMQGAVLAAREKIGDKEDEELLIFSSNDVVDKSAFELVKGASEGGEAESYILGKKVSEYFPGGYLSVNENGFISGIVEKPGEGNEPSDMINLVVHLHKNPKRLIEYLEKASSENDDKYEVALDEMMKEKVRMKAVEYDGFWQPIKFPWHIMKVAWHFFEKASKTVAQSAEISDKAVLKGDVIIGENVRIFEGAIVNGPVFIGDGSVIANNALVRDSLIGENCVIGYSTEVARSFLGHDVWTHSNYIGDSIIGNNVSFGSGTVTGNLRLDEENVRIKHEGDWLDTGSAKFGLVCGDNVRAGVNTSFMPGVKVGGNSFIGAGIVVAENIPDGSFVRGKWELKISENTVKANIRRRLG